MTAQAKSFKIHNETPPTTIRELREGMHFIQVGHLRRARGEGQIAYDIRERTEDPYKSKTLLGTFVRTFPSEKAFIVEVEDEHN